MTNTQVQHRQEGDNAFVAPAPQTALEDARADNKVAHFAYLLLIELSRPPLQINAGSHRRRHRAHTQEKRPTPVLLCKFQARNFSARRQRGGESLPPQEETQERELGFFQSNLPGLQRATE